MAPRLADYLSKDPGRNVIGLRLRFCDDASPSHPRTIICSTAQVHPQTMSKLGDVLRSGCGGARGDKHEHFASVVAV
jgi:hypothetical protein